MEAEMIEQVLFWAAVVFAAGFVGYFGKYLSKIVIRKLHKKEKQPTAEKPVYKTVIRPGQKGKYDYKIEKQRLKLEKKKGKAEENRRKGQGKKRKKT